MSKLLYLEVSPRKNRSASIEVAWAFIDAFKALSADNQVEKWDLWSTALPEFDGYHINAKYKVMHGEDPSPDEQRAWDQIAGIVDRFKQADHYLFSIPMWNFSIPYKLKHFLDVIVQPGLTFDPASESGSPGLITGKSITVIYARGGEYSSVEAQQMDLQKKYMEMILGFIGFSDIKSILVEPTMAGPELKKQAVADAVERAALLAGEI